MSCMTNKVYFIAALLVAFSVTAFAQDIPVATTENVAIPSVSANIAKADVPQRPTSQNSNSRPVSALNTGTEIVMKPGTNEIISIAINHLNRIVTPFDNPKIKTTQSGTSEVKDNVVYVVTSAEEPMTLFITDGDSQEEALSLTLIPQRIPPREITLKRPGQDSINGFANTKKAEKWEKSQPYMATLEELFRTVALGEVPSGYKFVESAEGEQPGCRQAGLSIDFTRGQTLLGHNLIMHVGVATNTTSEPIEFIEDACSDWDVAAVAAFPNHVVEPSKKTEIYVVRKRNSIKESKPKRPSLLSGV